MPENTPKYVIVTPAFNEAEYIEWTIESVLAQSVLPHKWIIVDDGSTDNTAEIIQRHTREHDWIEYIYREKNNDQSYYASNVYAIEKGIQEVAAIDYDYLAILDADITLPADYYEQIFMRLNGDERLGIASGVYLVREGEKLKTVLNDRRSCPKNIMVFRKECFEQIGGFVPMKYGGEDTCACFMARMRGWKSWSFSDVAVIHNKPVGTGHSRGLLRIRFRHGVGEYFMATHPLFMLFKSLRRCIKEKPIIIGGAARMAGFLYGYCLREKRQIPDDVVRFIHREQMGRLLNMNRIPEEHKAGSI